MHLKALMPASWQKILAEEFDKPYFKQLEDFLAEEIKKHNIYPKKGNIFTAFKLTAYEDVKVLLLGQDPYHGASQAHGLSFSVPPGVKIPPSLKNMYKELKDDLNIEISQSGSLVPWAEQGVMLLNAVLTVREGEAASHKNKGWEKFTDAVISKLNEKESPVVFILWGNYAKKKNSLIDQAKHIVIEGIHPSPLSASSGFFGSKPFSKVNTALNKLGKEPVNWKIS